MAAIITRTGKGAAITQSENDSNLDSLCGINEPQTGATYTVNAADQNSTIEFSNAAPVVATLALISTIIAANDTSDFQVSLKNIGAGVVTVTPTTDTFDDGSATKALAQYEWITIQTDSTQSLWNIIASSNASKVDGLDASQFLRSDINTTATGNVTIDKATPILNIDAASGDASLVFKEINVNASLIFRESATDTFSLVQRDGARTGNAARIDLTALGKIDIATGTLQLAGVDVNTALVTTGTTATNLTVSNNEPILFLNDEDAASDEKMTGVLGGNSQFKLATYTDLGAFTNTFFTMDRTGTVVDKVTLTATDIELDGVVTLGSGVVVDSTPVLVVNLGSGTVVVSATSEIPFDTVEIDTLGDFNTGTYRYTPSIAGYYSITMETTHFMPASGQAILSIRRNSTSLRQAHFTNPGANTYSSTIALSHIVEMNGTTNYLSIFNDLGTSTTLDGDSKRTKLLITRISGL